MTVVVGVTPFPARTLVIPKAFGWESPTILNSSTEGSKSVPPAEGKFARLLPELSPYA